MTVQARRQREKQLLRQEILDAARTLFVREGYDNVSMRKIAEKIDYSPTTIYLYFEDKAALLHAVCEETFTRLVEELGAIERSARDPVEGLKKGLRKYVDFGLSHPQHYLVTFVLPHEHGSHKGPDSLAMKAFSFLPRGIAECVRKKKFRAVDVEAAAQAMWAAVHGVTSLLIVKKEFPWAKRDALVDAVIEAAVRHLRA
jgi:AcrR family transcriptional regulator